ncbi:hypothetical protein BgAZ_105220 [Babesia gibsoni]|uniref:6-Cys domain-containing protein n=1 Tax=Babesia gibsoni TaxID=33632 RepID=A0AAD8PG10_BABGI|nr:hypothetical protein BgAZ_105220 [Babesia gibsoni]
MVHLLWTLPLLLAIGSSADDIFWDEVSVVEKADEAGKKSLNSVLLKVESGFSVKVSCKKPLSPIYGKPVVKYFETDEENFMTIHYPNIDDHWGAHADILRGNATHIHLVCAPPDDEVLLRLERCISEMYDNIGRNSLAFSEDIKSYFEKLNKPLGLIFLDISNVRKATYGCGSMETPQFEKQRGDGKENGILTCTVDIMEHPDVGFYCDGNIDPPSCFTELLSTETSSAIDLSTMVNVKSSHDNLWHFAQFDRRNISKPFMGYCKCNDRDSGELKAKITVITGMSHTCDFSKMVFWNIYNPIMGAWCDIGMMPGSILTIRLPINVYGPPEFKMIEGHQYNTVPVMSSYIFPVEMQKEFVHPSCLRTTFSTVIRLVMRDFCFGDALKFDTSKQFSEGIVTARYMKHRPFTYWGRLESLVYTWNLHVNKARYEIKDVRAAIQIVPSKSHEDITFGCEPPTYSSFINNPLGLHINRNVDIYGNKMNVCTGSPSVNIPSALYCPEGHVIEPEGCNSFGYNDTLQSVVDLTASINVSRAEEVPGLIFLHLLPTVSRERSSRACSCVDGDGIEKARLVINRDEASIIFYDSMGPSENMNMIVPSVRVVSKKIDCYSLPEIEDIPLCEATPERTYVLLPGIYLYIRCMVHHYERQLPITLNGRKEPFLVEKYEILDEASLDIEEYNQWGDKEPKSNHVLIFPLNKEKYFYQTVVSDDKRKLVPVEYSKVIGTNKAGYRSIHSVLTDAQHDYVEGLKLHNPMSAIIVSKQNRPLEHVKYVCGSLSKTHRRSQLNATTHVNNGESNEGARDDSQVEGNTVPNGSAESSQAEKREEDTSRRITDEKRSFTLLGVVDVSIPTTDPYLHGCGMTDPSEELFRDDTVAMFDDAGKKVGCEVDLTQGGASFYCPLPYHTEPSGCMPTSSSLTVRLPGDKGNKHMYVFTRSKWNKLTNHLTKYMKREPFECHCVTNKGIRMATIRVHSGGK